MRQQFKFSFLLFGLFLTATACEKLEIQDSQSDQPEFYLKANMDSTPMNLYAGRGYEMKAFYSMKYSDNPVYFSQFSKQDHDSLGFFFVVSNDNTTADVSLESIEQTFNHGISFGNPANEKGKLLVQYATDTAIYESSIDGGPNDLVNGYSYNSYSVHDKGSEQTHDAMKVNISFDADLYNIKNPNQVLHVRNASAILLFDPYIKK